MDRITKLLNVDSYPNDPFHANSMPIYQTATFELESAEGNGKYDYTRSGNPTRDAVCLAMASLENAKHALAFTTGMAAINVLTGLLKAGDHIIAGDDLYGGTYRLLTKRLNTRGISMTLVDMTNPANVEAAFTASTKMVLIETPSNPLHKVADLATIADITHRHSAIFAVDNSLMSPWLQRPFDFGADIVMHSATKFISGHSDVSGGFLLTNDDKLATDLAFIQNAEGCALAPFDSWLILRGMKTIGLRIERQIANAEKVALYLSNHSLVTKVYYAGLTTHPDAALHKTQASSGGAVISFETGNRELSAHIVNNTQLFNISVSFGSINSSISLPCNMSHVSITEPEQKIAPDLVRISIGIEDASDLIADLDNAFRRF
jgi:cystathionine beta-lyase